MTLSNLHRPTLAPATPAALASAAIALALLLAGCNGEPQADAPEPDAHDHAHADDHDHDHDHHHDHDHAHDDDGVEMVDFVGDPYPLSTCPVSGLSLDAMGGPAPHLHEGREIRFCCPGCDEDFEADAENLLAEIDAEIIEQQREHYPLETCIVEGTPLEEGDVVERVLYNRLFRVSSDEAAEAVAADFERYLAKLDEAVIDAQAETYALGETCVVSDEPVDAWDSVQDRVYHNRLVRFCCTTCEEDFLADPPRFFAALDEGVAVGLTHDHGGADDGDDHDHH